MSETFVFIYADSFPNGRKETKKNQVMQPLTFWREGREGGGLEEEENIGNIP